MHFGVINAPWQFIHMINDVFSDSLDDFVVMFLDDDILPHSGVVYSTSRESPRSLKDASLVCQGEQM